MVITSKQSSSYCGTIVDGKLAAKISFQDHTRIVEFYVDKIINSGMQEIIFGHNKSLGRLMVIDGEVQFTEIDYFVYHELMVWPAMILALKIKKAINVGILGGGDGFAASEVLKFGVIPTIIDLDPSVVNICRDNISDLNNGSLNKAHVVIGDALEYTPEEKFDVELIDLTAQSACPFLYGEDAINKYKSNLAPGGLILFYAEHMLARSFYPKLREYFSHSFAYGAFTPFVDSYFTFSLFSDSPIDSAKLKRTKRKGKYFCRQHIHEIDFSRLPKMEFEEKFEVGKFDVDNF